MNNLAFIDLDGVIVDCSTRLHHAEQSKQEYLRHGGETGQAGNVYWETVFRPDLVATDRLMEGANDVLWALKGAGYHIIFISSRQESMREATLDWFWEHLPDWNTQVQHHLWLKPYAHKYVRTSQWKAGVVHMQVSMDRFAKHILFVDDYAENRDEVHKYIFPSRRVWHIAGSISEVFRLFE